MWYHPTSFHWFGFIWFLQNRQCPEIGEWPKILDAEWHRRLQ